MTNFIKDLESHNPVVRDQARKACGKITRREGFTITDGIVRWDSNGRVPPEEWVQLAKTFYPSEVDVLKCSQARDKDTREFIEEYKKRQASAPPEIIAEQRNAVRAAHGPGVRMVNAITGETYTT